MKYDKLKKEYSHEIIGALGNGVAVCEGIAKAVKIADITHNLDTTRMPKGVPEKLERKRPTYEKALEFLKSED